MDTLPLLLLGDSPRMPTGLGRIARDLAAQLYDRREVLGIDLFQAGWEDQASASTAFTPPWPWAPFWDLGGDWGATTVRKMAAARFGPETPVILLGVWDPGRISAYVLGESWHGDTWGYLAVDGVNPKGTLGGMVPTTIRALDRVLAYGRWGSEILRPLRGDGPEAAIPYLPHGILPQAEPDWRPSWLDRLHPSRPILGVVGSNQPRKDWHAVIAALADLPGWQAWLHIDQLVTTAWSLPELITLYGVSDRVVVTTPDTPGMSDAGLYASYAACTVTLCPGKGEGFGYPLVESLALGTPAVGLDYAGGVELVPRSDWRVSPAVDQFQGAYVLNRPAFHVERLIGAIKEAAAFKAQPYGAAYCRGAVAHLDWAHLWPRWEVWVRRGLERVRAAGWGQRRRAILDAARAFTGGGSRG